MYYGEEPKSIYDSRDYMVNTYILTTNNELWGHGTNECAQLGKKAIKHTEDPGCIYW